MTVNVDKNVFGLQVPINNLVVVEVLERQYYFRYYYTGCLFFKYALSGQVKKEFATRAEFQHQMQVMFGLKGVLDPDDEGVRRYLEQQVALQEHLAYFSLLFYLLFQHYFHREKLSGMQLSNCQYF